MTWLKVASAPAPDRQELPQNLKVLLAFAKKIPNVVTPNVFKNVLDTANRCGFTEFRWGQNLVNAVRAKMMRWEHSFDFHDFHKRLLKDFYAVRVSVPFTERPKNVTFGEITIYEVEKFPVDDKFREEWEKAYKEQRQTDTSIAEIEDAEGEDVLVYGGTIELDDGKKITMLVPME